MIYRLGQILEKIPEVKVAYIYGSHASKNARPDSDLDVGISASHKLSVDDLLKYKLLLEKKLNIDVDLVDMYHQEGLLLKEILTKGTCIVNRDSGLNLRFIQKLYSFTEDYEPLYRKMLVAKLDNFLGVS